MSKGRGKLVVISGPSGVGKSTVCDHLLRQPGFSRVVTCTTRAPRSGEVSGRDYHFLSSEEFENKMASNGFLEHARVHENYYGTPVDAVREALDADRILLLAIDVQGAEQLRRTFNNPAAGWNPEQLVTIFLMSPDEDTLKARLRGRGTESDGDLAVRLKAAQEEIAQKDKYDHVIVNSKLKDTVAEIVNCIRNAASTSATIRTKAIQED